jgi:hypothetical protein
VEERLQGLTTALSRTPRFRRRWAQSSTALEHLGTTDTAIIQLRRYYLDNIRQILEGGEPFVPANPSVDTKRSVSALDRSLNFDQSVAYFETRQPGAASRASHFEPAPGYVWVANVKTFQRP